MEAEVVATMEGIADRAEVCHWMLREVHNMNL